MPMIEGISSAEAREMKQRLYQLGYDVDDTEHFDMRTQWALRWFCQRNALQYDTCAMETLGKRLFSLDAKRGVDDGFPYYSMRDPLWADAPYDAALTPEIETISTSGCGPTSMAMAVSYALRRAVLPPVLADWSNAHGHRDPHGIEGTYDTFFPACAQEYGLTATLVPMEGEETFRAIDAHIQAGHSVIANVVPGSPFTSCGHYNLIAEIRGEYVHICDPSPRNMEKPDYTMREWIEGHWMRHCLVISPEA